MIEKSALFYKAKDAETQEQIFVGDFANGKLRLPLPPCISLSFRFRLTSRSFRFTPVFPDILFLFPSRGEWVARERAFCPFSLWRLLVCCVSPCASASEIFIPDCCRTAVSPCSPVNIASSVIHRDVLQYWTRVSFRLAYGSSWMD